MKKELKAGEVYETSNEADVLAHIGGGTPPPNPLSDFGGSISVEKDIDNDYRPETATFIGGELEINGFKFPPVATGTLIFLEMVESPFIVKADRDIASADVFEALYVLKYKGAAIKDIYSIMEAKKYLDFYDELTEKGPEYLKLVLEFRERHARSITEFKSLAAAWSESLGVVNIDEAAVKISLYIQACLNAFEILPDVSDGTNEKKKPTAMMANG